MLPSCDKTLFSTARLYTNYMDYVNDTVPGKTFADKFNELVKFYDKYHNKSPIETFGEEYYIFCEGIGKAVYKTIKKMEDEDGRKP